MPKIRSASARNGNGKFHDICAVKYTSDSEKQARQRLVEMLRQAPIPEDQLLANLGLFIDSKNLSRMLFMDFLFRSIVDVQGVVMEFGTRWGQNSALFAALRGIHDPFNRHRKIIAFDTFTGFPSVSKKDGRSAFMKSRSLAVPSHYEQFLEEILSLHERLAPLSHLKKFEVRKGDAAVEIDRYLQDAPHTIVALAYFDMDIYEPTKKCLEALKDRLTRGSILAFDELNDADAPGETRALAEVFGLRKVELKRFSKTSRASYFVVR